MPHIGGTITPWGPLLNVLVNVSQPRAQALQKAGQPIPQPVVAKLVVDTGATLTAIDKSILAQLQLTPKGQTAIHTPSTQNTPVPANLFDIAMVILGATAAAPFAHMIAALAVIDGDFKPQGIDGLLGRDVLASARVIYSGSDQIFMMSF